MNTTCLFAYRIAEGFLGGVGEERSGSSFARVLLLCQVFFLTRRKTPRQSKGQTGYGMYYSRGCRAEGPPVHAWEGARCVSKQR